MNTKNIITIIIISVIVFVLGFNIFGGKTIETKIIEKQIGAIPGDTVNSPCFTINGVQRCYTKIGLKQATTTIGAIKTPSASSTLIAASCEVRNATTSHTIVLAKNTSTLSSPPAATTTILAEKAGLAANAQYTLVATSTNQTTETGANTEAIFAPNTWLLCGIHGGTFNDIGGFAPQGSFQAEFTVTN